MDAPKEMWQRADLRDYLVAERTFLAWIRTGSALVGFGFVVARLGVFVQQLQIARHAPSLQPYGQSLWFGTALIGAGKAVNLFSGWQHLRPILVMYLGQVARPLTVTLRIPVLEITRRPLWPRIRTMEF